MKYIPAEKLIAEIERMISVCETQRADANEVGCNELADYASARMGELNVVLETITSLQQEQLIEGKQVIIITETNGEANIHWECRSLDDVRVLLTSAESFIADKQIEELRGQGSGPDHNTTEGRYSSLFKHRQEQPEVVLEKFDLEKFDKEVTEFWGRCVAEPNDSSACLQIDSFIEIARHFYKLGLNARKEE